MSTITFLDILFFKGTSVLVPTDRVSGSERVRFQLKSKKLFGFYWDCLKSVWVKIPGVFKWILILLNFLLHF